MPRPVGQGWRAALASVTLLWPVLGWAQDDGQAGDFDLYVLALSWSPGFCAAHPQETGSRQCAAHASSDVVVHGLWPQYERGYPLRCPAIQDDPRAADITEIEDAMPSRSLARHEWVQHGTCSGLPARTYFAAIAGLYGRYARPLSAALGGSASPGRVKAALRTIDPRIQPVAVQIVCERSGELADIRLCLARDLSGPRSCPEEMRRRDCRASPRGMDPG